jgi:membrane protease YdiL (CAAX protease family)
VIPYEEVVFRGFIFNRLKKICNGSFILSGLITSILFALYHLQEGWGAVIAIFIFALFITWLYKVFKGNLWYLIFFHLAYDVFMLTTILKGWM